MVPVVFGGADYSRIAPPHSFINALQFTPESLAAYLRLLDGNDALYNEYFWWKTSYQVEAGSQQMAAHGMCDLCQKLHEDTTTKSWSSERLMKSWYVGNQCRTFKDWNDWGTYIDRKPGQNGTNVIWF